MRGLWWLPPVLLLIAALLQASFFPALGVQALRPDLVLQVVVIWAVLRGAREAIAWGFTGGLLLDLFSEGPLGTAALALTLVAFCASAGEGIAFRTGFLLPAAIVFWASVAYGLVFLFLLRTHQYPVEWVGTLRHVVVPGAILNTVCTPFTYWVLSKLERRTRSTVQVEW